MVEFIYLCAYIGKYIGIAWQSAGKEIYSKKDESSGIHIVTEGTRGCGVAPYNEIFVALEGELFNLRPQRVLARLMPLIDKHPLPLDYQSQKPAVLYIAVRQLRGITQIFRDLD